MPTYSGDAATLGFPEGTGTVYELITTSSLGWANRMIIDVDPTYDYLKVDVVFSAAGKWLTMWPANETSMFGSYTVSASGASTSDGDPDRKVFVFDQNGNSVSKFEANTVYTVYFYLKSNETKIHLGSFTNTTVYVAKLCCGNGNVAPVDPVDPVVPNIFTQDKAAPLSVYSGDETALGFAEGTTVMQLQTKGVTWSDAAYVSLDKTTSCLTINFSFETVPAAGLQLRIHAWYSGSNGWIGSVQDCASSSSMVTIPKGIEVLDANGNAVTEWQANTVYTLKIYHEGANALVICMDHTTIAKGSIISFDNEIIQNNDVYVAP